MKISKAFKLNELDKLCYVTETIAGQKTSVLVALDSDLPSIFDAAHRADNSAGAATHCNGRDKSWEAIKCTWYTGKVRFFLFLII